MKRFKLIILSVSGLIAVSILALVIWLWAEGAFRPPPDIPRAHGSRIVRDSYTPELRRLFPSGSDEAALIRYLRRKGFQVSGRHAVYEWQNIPACSFTLTVDWNKDADGRLGQINSFWGDICL